MELLSSSLSSTIACCCASTATADKAGWGLSCTVGVGKSALTCSLLFDMITTKLPKASLRDNNFPMDEDHHDGNVCLCCCNLTAEEAEEEATLDQTEMTLSVLRTWQNFRDAAQSCVVCAVLMSVLSFFGVPQGSQGRGKVVLQLPVGPGNVQIAFQGHDLYSVIQLYASACKCSIDWCTSNIEEGQGANIFQRSQDLGGGCYRCLIYAQISCRRKAEVS